MKDWETMFKIVNEPRTIYREDGITVAFETTTHYIVLKHNNEKVFPKYRKYGYSTRIDAQRGAAHIYRNYQIDLEKTLLG
jgi:hypothetical protein